MCIRQYKLLSVLVCSQIMSECIGEGIECVDFKMFDLWEVKVQVERWSATCSTTGDCWVG